MVCTITNGNAEEGGAILTDFGATLTLRYRRPSHVPSRRVIGTWPVNSLMLGGQTYSKAELLSILNTPIGAGKNADASLILADQLIAANLNVANGADDPAPVPATITDADALFFLYSGKLPYRVKPSSTNGQRMVNDAAILESFSKGFLTPGCGG